MRNARILKKYSRHINFKGFLLSSALVALAVDVAVIPAIYYAHSSLSFLEALVSIT